MAAIKLHTSVWAAWLAAGACLPTGAGARAEPTRHWAAIPGVSAAAGGVSGWDVAFLTWERHSAVAWGLAAGGTGNRQDGRRYLEAEAAALVSPHGDILAAATLGLGLYDGGGAWRAGEKGVQVTAALWVAPLPVALYLRQARIPAGPGPEPAREFGVMLKLPLVTPALY